MSREEGSGGPVGQWPHAFLSSLGPCPLPSKLPHIFLTRVPPLVWRWLVLSAPPLSPYRLSNCRSQSAAALAQVPRLRLGPTFHWPPRSDRLN